MRIHGLTGFQRDTLAVIAGLEEPSGADIMDELETIPGVGGVTRGRLYPNLDSLVAEGFVRKGRQDRRTNVYTLTQDGVAALREYDEWLRTHIDAAGDAPRLSTGSGG